MPVIISQMINTGNIFWALCPNTTDYLAWAKIWLQLDVDWIWKNGWIWCLL